jgi:long-chain fatty acid transport protein
MIRFTALAIVLATGTAHAGGMVLPISGVRGVGRAGALVAGAEDPDALWQNPAGLAHMTGENAMSVGVTYVNQSVDYARIDSGGNQMEAISDQHPGFPIPSIAAVFGVGDKLVVGVGFAAPYGALHRYDLDGPQRYASISLAESRIEMITAGVAYAITPRLRIGATVSNVLSNIKSRVILSGCPGQTVCAPEDPEFDADTEVHQLDLLAPTASVGIQFEPDPRITLGVSAQAPAKISGNGELKTRLPSSGFFEGAMVTGDQAKLEMTVPPYIRFGMEGRPDPRVRVEAAIAVELWSMHDNITITPEDVRIENVAGVGTYVVGPTTIPRNFKNSYAASLGGEYRFAKHAVATAGYAYETAAAPEAYVSVMTVDAAKHIIGLGGVYEVAGYQFGAALGFVKQADVDVSLAEARVPQLTPVRDQPSEPVYVNAGNYKSTYVLAGLRFAKHW